MANSLIGFVQCFTDDQNLATQYGTLVDLGVASSSTWIMDRLTGCPAVQTAFEEVIGLGSYSKTQTILTSIELPDEVEDKEIDGEFEAAWTPRLQR